MAEVHLANAAPWSEVPQLVVVKRMHEHHADDPSAVRMFLDEARLALRLSHPNIVRTDRLGVFDGRRGMVMEFLEGQPFHQVLKRAYQTEASLSLELVAQIAIAALEGLHYAHELKGVEGQPLSIVHRDVSPQNLFITYDGAVKLLDFGIAKNALQDGRTRTGLLKGKVSYMAPEQARGDALDRRADLWSLGVVLWEAVTGTRLFRGANEAATLNMTLTESVSAPSLHRPDLPPELEAILLRALERDPGKRYASAAAMRDDLETWLEARELLPSASVSQLMQRLFGKEMREQRQQIEALLRTQPDPTVESMTLTMPLLGTSATASGLRATQMSSVTDLVEELTRQRRTTTLLLGTFLLLASATMLVGLYFLLHRPAPASPATAATPRAVVATPPATAGTSAGSATPEPALEHGKAHAVAVARPGKPLAYTRPSNPPKHSPSSTRTGAPIERESRASSEPTSARAETGRLNLDTSPWSIVSVGERILGQTPIIGATLPAGTHTLVLSNPEQSLKTTYQITISAGQTTARRVGLD